MAIELVSCPACGRKNASDRTTCLSCGADLPIPDASEQKPVQPPWATFLWQRIKKVRLNGWQRLWLVVTVLWLVLFTFVWYSAFFIGQVSYDEIIVRLPLELSALLVNSDDRITAREDREGFVFRGGHLDPEILKDHSFQDLSPAEQNYIRTLLRIQRAVSLPKSYSLTFRREVSEENMRRVIVEFSRKAHDLNRAKLKRDILNFFIFGFGPLILLYALGWAIAWVRRGFRTP